MKTRSNWLKYFWITLAALSVLVTAFCIVKANGPDKDLTFTREVYSNDDIETLDRKIYNILSWPEWHHMTIDAKMIDFRGNEYSPKNQTALTGGVVKFVVEPKANKWRRFELLTRITEYEPKKVLHMMLLQDSNGKISRLFDRMEWRIELLPSDKPRHKALIRGTLYAHTNNWRSRLVGSIAHRALMNQIFYPDLPVLAGLQTKQTSDMLGPSRPVGQPSVDPSPSPRP